MTSKRNIEGRIEEQEERTADLNNWRSKAGLPANATRTDGWRAAMDGEMSDEAWQAYIEAGMESGRR